LAFIGKSVLGRFSVLFRFTGFDICLRTPSAYKGLKPSRPANSFVLIFYVRLQKSVAQGEKSYGTIYPRSSQPSGQGIFLAADESNSVGEL
jgi:hypothetical protein